MQLEWIRLTPKNDDGVAIEQNYLVNTITSQCYAMVIEPRDGNLLFVTDIRVSGDDRSYITLDAAKNYCELVAMEFEREECQELEKSLKKATEPAEKVEA
jgi:hypothetical protein